MTRLSEDELIARYFRPLATGAGALGLGDDAAVLAPPPGHDLVLTKDALAAGIHFFPDDPWDEVSRKALRVNLSDLAAKGAAPLGYLLALALPGDWTEPELAAFAAGLAADQAAYGVALLGGDTIRSPAGLVVSITALGAVPAGAMVPRGGAKPGDRLYVSGTIGDAALGLCLRREPHLAESWGLAAADRRHLLARYLRPEPRLALAPALRAHASAAMDISDGLLGDLSRLCRVSGVGAVIELERVPLSPAARTARAADATAKADCEASDVEQRILTGGDDYEILAAIPAENAGAFAAAAQEAGVAVAMIGRVLDAEPGAVHVLNRHGAPIAIAARGFSHF